MLITCCIILSFRYPDDPELTFDTLSTITFLEPELPSESGLDIVIKAMEDAIEALEVASEILESSYELAKDLTEKCITIPETVCVPVIMGQGGCMSLPFRAICKTVGGILVNVAFGLKELAAAALWVLEHALSVVRIYNTFE
jgi:hypothetical protein